MSPQRGRQTIDPGVSPGDGKIMRGNLDACRGGRKPMQVKIQERIRTCEIRAFPGVAPAERLNHAYAWLNCAGAQLNQAPAGLG